MRRLLLVLVCILPILMFTGCCLSHEWKDATCTSPKTCIKCDKTDGEPLPHIWDEATCITPKTCSVCGTTEGDTLEHTWVDADCIKAKTCCVCMTTDGEPLGHNWVDATCTVPKTCSACSATEGTTLEHNYVWTTTKEPAYFSEGEKEGICSICGEHVVEALESIVPVYYWNEPIQISPEITLGFYTDGSEYWFEMTGATFNSGKLMLAIEWGEGDIGFGRTDLLNWIDHVIDIADDAWVNGELTYCSAEGYGIKWTVYMNMDENEPGTVGLKVNKESEIEAACNVDVLEREA